MKCRCFSSYTVPAYIWAVLSIIAAILCPFGLYFSNWLERETSDGKGWDSVSSFRVCRNESSRISTSCSSYRSFDQIFSDEWKAVTLLMGAGACLLVLVALTALFGFCVTKLFNKTVVVLTFCFQLLGGKGWGMKGQSLFVACGRTCCLRLPCVHVQCGHNDVKGEGGRRP
jgi:hypothetical protein